MDMGSALINGVNTEGTNMGLSVSGGPLVSLRSRRLSDESWRAMEFPVILHSELETVYLLVLRLCRFVSYLSR